MSLAKKVLAALLAISFIATSIFSVVAVAYADESGTKDEQISNSANEDSSIYIGEYSYEEWLGNLSVGCCTDEDALCGIDVSEHNGELDWVAIKEAGVDFVVIRAGYIGNTQHSIDKQFFDNVQGCLENDIPFGIYAYSYVKNAARAEDGAKHVLSLLEEAGVEASDLALPVYLDLEDASTIGSDFEAIAEAFCDVIEEAGFEAGVYANKYWWEHYLTADCFETWHVWVAQYNNAGLTCSKVDENDFLSRGAVWQFSDSGKIANIDGVCFDLNYANPASHKVRTSSQESILRCVSSISFLAER